jgi:hypothetical protein
MMECVWFARDRDRLPAAVRARLGLRPRERVLAWATGGPGGEEWYVGTDLALYLPPAGPDARAGVGHPAGSDPAGDGHRTTAADSSDPVGERPGHAVVGAGGYRRLPWEEIERADWQHEVDRLAIVEVADFGLPERRTVLHLVEPGRLLELLRERVTKSVVYTRFTPVRRARGLSVVGRRSPSGRGPVTWSLVLSAGLDPSDPDVERAANETLEIARRELEGL